MYLELIKTLSEKRSGGLKKLASDIGMSEQNLHRCIRNNKIQASDLEKICEILGVKITTFFELPDATSPTPPVQVPSTRITTSGTNAAATLMGNITTTHCKQKQTAEHNAQTIATIEALRTIIAAKDATIAALEAALKDKDLRIADKEQYIALLREARTK